MIRTVLCGWTVLAFISAVPAHTQETAPQDTILTFELDEVVVTASRTGSPAIGIPLALEVVNASDFLSSRNAGLDEMLQSVPGVMARSRSGSQDVRLTVRGFGARGNGDRSNAATIRGIKILIDGIPETEPDGRTSLDLVDLSSVDRIEVLRSNASTLFGNASGGVINIRTVRPVDHPFLEFRNTFGSFGLRRNNVRLALPLGSGQLDVSATSAAFAGWRRHSSSSSGNFRLSALASLGPSSNLTTTAAIATNRFDIPGPLTPAEFMTDPSRAHPVYEARRERRDNRVGKLSLLFSTAIGSGHSLDITGFVSPKTLKRSERNTFRDFNRSHIGGGFSSHWKIGDSSFVRRITVGLDEAYQDGSILFYNLINGERGDSLRTNKREGAETFGVFAQGEFHLTGPLTAFLGARYDLQNYRSETFPAGATQAPDSDRLTFARLTPRFSLLYRISPRHSAYINIAGGLEVPAFNEVDPPPAFPSADLNPVLKPMTSTTYELGMKGELPALPLGLIRVVSYSFAVYRIDIRNEIVPWDGGAWFLSAGESRRYGFEGGWDMDFPGGVALRTAFTLLDSRYRRYTNELGEFRGKRVPGIPPVVLNARLRSQHSFGGYAEVRLEHVGSFFSDDVNTLSVPSATLLDGSVGYRIDAGRFSFHSFLGVENILNRRFASSAFINPAGSSFLEPGLPRNLFGGFSLVFLF